MGAVGQVLTFQRDTLKDMAAKLETGNGRFWESIHL